jgi:hypothetical protein
MQEQVAPRLFPQVDPLEARSEYTSEVLSDAKSSVSLIAPAYNESAIIQTNLAILCDYMRSLESRYDWEIVVVNDGSKDDTGWLAEEFARHHSQVRVVHHRTNRGLGQALRTGFGQCQGDYIIVVDLDLSYATEHIQRMLERIQHTQSQVVVASPYMPGGSIANVPWLRETLSIWANRFLAAASKQNLATLTGMVRAYDARFLKSLSLRASGMDINPEVIHKALLLGAKVEEIPGHLHWPAPDAKAKPAPQTSTVRPHLPPLSATVDGQSRGDSQNRADGPSQGGKKKRRSSMRLLHHTWDILFSGFLLRPVMFFVLPSLASFALAFYAGAWVLVHCWTNYQSLAQQTPFPSPTVAVAQAFNQAPHTFFIGGISLMLGVQLFSLGILSSQNKSYYEELFTLGTTLYRYMQSGRSPRSGSSGSSLSGPTLPSRHRKP